MVLYIAFLGAVMNKIRGGVLTDLFNRDIPLVKPLNAIVFGGLFTFLITYEISVRSTVVFIVLTAMMFVGTVQGWGSYILGINEKVIATKIRKQIKWIDDLVFVASSYPVLRNCLAFGLRGLMWTVPLALAFWICSLLGFYIAPTFVWIAPLGLLIGLPYVFAARNISEPWAFGELFWGFILWGSCAALI